MRKRTHHNVYRFPMKKRIHHNVYDDAARVVGYVRQWNRKWYAIHLVHGEEYRCGVFADRTQAIAAVLQADAPPGQQPEQPTTRTPH
jgi:hypothetical protein